MQRDAIQTSMTLGLRLCDALGIDHRDVTEIAFSVKAGDVVRVQVTRLMRNSSAGLVLAELAKQTFEWSPVASADVRPVKADDTAPGAG